MAVTLLHAKHTPVTLTETALPLPSPAFPGLTLYPPICRQMDRLSQFMRTNGRVEGRAANGNGVSRPNGGTAMVRPRPAPLPLVCCPGLSCGSSAPSVKPL